MRLFDARNHNCVIDDRCRRGGGLPIGAPPSAVVPEGGVGRVGRMRTGSCRYPSLMPVPRLVSAPHGETDGGRNEQHGQRVGHACEAVLAATVGHRCRRAGARHRDRDRRRQRHRGGGQQQPGGLFGIRAVEQLLHGGATTADRYRGHLGADDCASACTGTGPCSRTCARSGACTGAGPCSRTGARSGPRTGRGTRAGTRAGGVLRQLRRRPGTRRSTDLRGRPGLPAEVRPGQRRGRLRVAALRRCRRGVPRTGTPVCVLLRSSPVRAR